MGIHLPGGGESRMQLLPMANWGPGRGGGGGDRAPWLDPLRHPEQLGLLPLQTVSPPVPLCHCTLPFSLGNPRPSPSSLLLLVMVFGLVRKKKKWGSVGALNAAGGGEQGPGGVRTRPMNPIGINFGVCELFRQIISKRGQPQGSRAH